MSTLLDLIQTKVNYVVQEAIVVIKDIFRKYPNKYVAASPCEGVGNRGGGRKSQEEPLPSAENSVLKRNPLSFLTSPELPDEN